MYQFRTALWSPIYLVLGLSLSACTGGFESPDGLSGNLSVSSDNEGSTIHLQSVSGSGQINVVETMISDMRKFHDGPCDVLSALKGWGSGASYPEVNPRPSGYQYAIPWSHTMEDTSHANGHGLPWRVSGPYTGNQAPNTRVQQRDIQMWWLLSDGRWVLGSHNSTPGKTMYPTHWAEGTEKRGTDIHRLETSNGGGSSMRSIGRENYEDHLWHAWASPNPIPANVVGVATGYFARLILDNPSGYDDRHLAHILSAGAGDWYKSELTAKGLDGQKIQGVNVIYMGWGRLKYVTKDWQLFSWTDLSDAQIRANPPPFIGVPSVSAPTPAPTPAPAPDSGSATSNETNLEAGSSYRIVSSCGNGDKVVAAGSFPGIALATKSTNSNQIFKASVSGSGFALESSATGKVIGVIGDATYSGAKIEQRTASGHATQRFVANSLGSGLVSIRNLGSGYFLNVTYDRTADGTTFNQSQFWNTCGQKFKLEKVSTSAPTSPTGLTKTREYFIQADMSKLCLRSSGSSVIQAACDTSAAMFEEYKDASGLLEIRQKGANSCLGLAKSAAVTALDAPMSLESCDGSLKQRFLIAPTSSGKLQFVNQASKMCLNVAGSSLASGAALIQWTCGDWANESFNILSTLPTTTVAPPPPPPPAVAPPPPSASNTTFSIQLLLDDMRFKNDLPWALAASSGPKGWSYGPGYITQGLMYGDSIANWFKASPDRAFISANKFWNKVRPWWVVWPGQGHDGTNNFRVHIRNYETYILKRSTGRWVKVSYIGTENRGWAEWYGEQNAPYGDQAGAPPRTIESDGLYSIQHAPGNKVTHGGSFHYTEINPSDVIALHTRAEVRLVGTDAKRTTIKPMFQIGSDFEPAGASPSQFGYMPGVGGSRLKLITPEWKAISFTTVRPNDVNTVQTPHNPSRKSYLTEQELRANPPPGVN